MIIGDEFNVNFMSETNSFVIFTIFHFHNKKMSSFAIKEEGIHRGSVMEQMIIKSDKDVTICIHCNIIIY